MKVIETTNQGATVELTKDDLVLLSHIGTELFGGSFKVTEDDWDAVFPPRDRSEAKAFMRQFHEILLSTKQA